MALEVPQATVRYERREENSHEAFLHLSCSLIWFNYLS